MYSLMDHIVMFIVMFVPLLLILTAMAALADFLLYRGYERKRNLMAERKEP